MRGLWNDRIRFGSIFWLKSSIQPENDLARNKDKTITATSMDCEVFLMGHALGDRRTPG